MERPSGSLGLVGDFELRIIPRGLENYTPGWTAAGPLLRIFVYTLENEYSAPVGRDSDVTLEGCLKGIRINSALRFERTFEPCLDAFSSFYWLLELPAGPFAYTHLSGFEEIDAELDRYLVGETRLWRPGIFPRFAKLLVHDEWSYHVALLGDENEAIRIVTELNTTRWLSPEFFKLIEEKTELLLVHINGWWEVYSTREEWVYRFRKLASVSDLDSSHFQHEL